MFKFSRDIFLRLIISLIDLIFYYNKKDILFHGYMGVPSGNNLALFNYMSADTKASCNFWWTGKVVNSVVSDFKNIRDTPDRNTSFLTHFSYLLFLMRFKVLLLEGVGDLSLYLRFLPRSRRFKVLLNHGFCLKSSGVLAPSLSLEQKSIWKKVGNSFDLFSVSSKLERYMLSSTYNGPVEKFKVIGPQRSMNVVDFTDQEKINARDLIAQIYNVKHSESDELVFYTPTHRDHLEQVHRPVLFGCDHPLLNQILLNAGVFLFVREHGLTSSVIPENYSNIIYTADRDYVDFHKLAPGIDGLITDYSGIFLEYLRTDIKLGFWQHDYQEYVEARGFSVSNSIFECGWGINDDETLIEFLEVLEVPKNMKIKRDMWHAILYENTTIEALKMTTHEITKMVTR